MKREDTTGTVYYGSTADDDFSEAMGMLQSGGGELNTGTLRIQGAPVSGTDGYFVRVYYTWMDDSHHIVKCINNNGPLGYTIFRASSGDAYGYFNNYGIPSAPTFGMVQPPYMWAGGPDGSEGITENSSQFGFIKYAVTNVVTSGSTAKSSIAILNGGSANAIYVYDNVRTKGPYPGDGRITTRATTNNAQFTLLGPICDPGTASIATTAKFSAMNSQVFSAGDFMIGGHRFKHIGSGIFLYGES